MNSLSEYIPFFLILGVIILSVRKGLNKQREDEMSKTTLPGRKSGNIITEQEAVPVRSKKIDKRKSIQPHPQKVSKPVAEVQSSVPVEVEDLGHTEDLVLDVENIEDIRKAVIYSEIFNRSSTYQR